MKIEQEKFIINLISTCFGIGRFPVFPGTVTSAVAALALFFLPEVSIFYSLVVLNLLFLVGTICSEFSEQLKGKDHKSIVVDEWFGMWLSLVFAPKTIFAYLLGFLLFRFFDIVKPGPILLIEKKVPGGLGIMLDDACAGIFSILILEVVFWLF
jgi:phosphatidylglycerophosphatase A